jgi:hypothetical protein
MLLTTPLAPWAEALRAPVPCAPSLRAPLDFVWPLGFARGFAREAELCVARAVLRP